MNEGDDYDVLFDSADEDIFFKYISWKQTLHDVPYFYYSENDFVIAYQRERFVIEKYGNIDVFKANK